MGQDISGGSGAKGWIMDIFCRSSQQAICATDADVRGRGVGQEEGSCYFLQMEALVELGSHFRHLPVPLGMFSFFFFFLNVYLFLRERERGIGAEREGDRGSEADSALTEKSLTWGSNS